jgi:exopolyphosphatase / guanosine-5'-triphosphate,3'-diphosphate pyrophosphatase
VTTPGDRPLVADANAAGVVVADEPRGPVEPGAEPSLPSPGKPGQGRKHRRRKRRRPVYAPGSRPAGEATTPVVAEQPAAVQQVSATPVAAQSSLYGALDLGTNNCRLLVATPRDYGFRVVDAFSRIVRLGEGVGQSGRLAEAAMERAVEALAVCAGKLAERQVGRARLIATEACRTAANGPEFIELVARRTGLRLEIVSREAEARLAVAGCASLVDPNASGVILFDIGGGSSELVWIDLVGSGDGRRRRISDRIRAWMSLPVGVVNVSERHGGRHISPAQFVAMVDEVEAMLAGFPEVEALDRAVAGGNVHMLGTSGTVTTLAGIHLGLPRYDRKRVDGTWLTSSQVSALVDQLVAMDYDGRVANPCIGRERADLVLAGCAIMEAFRRRWPCERMRVADRGLREGALVEMMAEDGVWRPRSGRRFGERDG